MVDQTLNDLLDRITWDDQGLVPAIVQDISSKDVLMMAYMNKESLKLSLETRETWFWSRSRQKLWHKGETSGHTQSIIRLNYDCDADTMLVFVNQKGPACHTGEQSCFFNEVAVSKSEDDVLKDHEANNFNILAVLESVIAKRYEERTEGAYTTYLFDKGVDKILKKVGEETAEVIIAAKNKDNEELTYEVSDLMFHLMVLLKDRDLPIKNIMKELEKRHVD
ncbi:bifunctional phosphoribosyl-AMP cyclohydrolase/phosphoribosyl-ATP diphosphatase HisIE [Chengkuizengella sediminis]|uniref:bifunctional phosphoribosyl-AMP cyclohydrolase/phosphoribosyl-ATP diphosphatase HisIE n=1 Tax=Chengkuizengella sediminis TaxID=1885917 RepID=UPI001389E3B4|nr:bifunctional phosphoribosyl-AMP cyclohydrolase/phosphoribosyl-ATP diphosphatase HisIE [Chengkuizengella sediminis]NDI36573.1 bifunctional phosphoribosyl-AMP cyclohydrolase/phosphoribosyl-ATP diphosphatase HisIE [Chengkuizengella sediminis]